jgi:ectoine hydroxylase-related dioxygenase (phytanoyl-CoA dioxygenase family)
VTDEVERYRRDGYLVVEGLLDHREVAAIREEAVAICSGQRGAIEGLLPVAPGADPDATIARYLCLHFPHKVSELLTQVMRHPRIVDVLARLVGPNVKCMQSMLFIKHAGKPGQAWHQDENFIPTRDRSLTAAWIALDDATVRNGCLWAIPGSHRPGILWPDLAHGDGRFDSVPEARGFPWPREGGESLPVRAGGVVFFNGYLLHRSLPNTAEAGFRRALVYHYMSAESLLPWDWAGRTAPTRDNRDIAMVCGEDPHAHKGIADITRPFLRAEAGPLAAGGRA